jgi:hypothetical protein
LELKDDAIYWPSAEERKTLITEFQHLPNCIGWIDGTHVYLDEAPSIDKESYFNKNKVYDFHFQTFESHP